MTDPTPSPEAVEAVGTALWDLRSDLDVSGPAWLDDPNGDEWAEWAGDLILVAEPHIRKAVLAEVRERLWHKARMAEGQAGQSRRQNPAAANALESSAKALISFAEYCDTAFPEEGEDGD